MEKIPLWFNKILEIKMDKIEEEQSPKSKIRASIEDYFESEKKFSPRNHQKKNGDENPFSIANEEAKEKLKNTSLKINDIKSQFDNFDEPDSGNKISENKCKSQVDSKEQISRVKVRTKVEEVFPKKHILNLHKLPLFFETFMATALLINLKSLMYTLFILPIRAAWGFMFSLCGKKKKKRLRCDLYFFIVILVVVSIFTSTSNISSIYHWIKGKAFIKLLTLYVIMDLSDVLSRSVGKDLIYCLARNVFYKKNCVKATILLCIHTLAHTYILLFQMLTLNSVLKSSVDTFFLFLLSNNFTEIKVFVFKKTDSLKLFDIATRDVTERLQQYIYICYLLLSNYLDQWTLTAIGIFCVVEFGVDWIKHFFFGNDNGHHPTII